MCNLCDIEYLNDENAPVKKQHEHEHNFDPKRNSQTGLLVGVCECGETIDHMGEPI